MIKLDCNEPKNTRTGAVTGKRLYLLMKPISLSKGMEKTIVQRSQTEHIRTGHLQQTVKHPPEMMF
jgi:hypothetical protein